jgi:hypothetical protein
LLDWTGDEHLRELPTEESLAVAQSANQVNASMKSDDALSVTPAAADDTAPLRWNAPAGGR